MGACFEGHREIVTLLIQRKAHLAPLVYGNRTPLMNACCKGHLETVKILLSYGADRRPTFKVFLLSWISIQVFMLTNRRTV